MSTSHYGPLVPDGQNPPYAVVTPDDHSAWILIATTLGICAAVVFGCIRIFVRLTISPKFKADDFTLAAATLLAIIQSGIVLGACSKGLGKSVDLVSPQDQDDAQQMYYTSNLFFIVALGLSKISVVCFLLRLSSAKYHKILFKSAIGVIGAWTIASLFAVALQCNLSHPWISVGESCSGTFTRWQVISAFDIITEIGVVAMTLYLVWGLKTSIANKAVVVSVFGCRLFMIIAIAFRLSTFDQAGWTSNPLLLEAPFVAWTQSELNYSIISATIPSFQNFLKNLNTQFGGMGPDESGYGYGSGSGSRVQKTGNTYVMSKLGTASAMKSSARDEEDDYTVDMAKPEGGTPVNQDHAIATKSSTKRLTGRHDSEGTGADAVSIDSNESRRQMIKKDVTWNVRYE